MKLHAMLFPLFVLFSTGCFDKSAFDSDGKVDSKKEMDCDELAEAIRDVEEACEDGDSDTCEKLDELLEWYEDDCDEDGDEDGESDRCDEAVRSMEELHEACEDGDEDAWV